MAWASPSFSPAPHDSSSPVSPSRQGSALRGHIPSPANTTMSQMFILTPASGRSVSSAAPSPYMRSLQPSPDILHGNDSPQRVASPAPFELPESIMANNIVNNDSGARETVTVTPAKTPSIIRKLSQSAKAGVVSTSRQLRRKASANGQGRREHSTGPMIRQRSGSKSTISTGTSVVESLPSGTDDVYAFEVNGLVGDNSSVVSEPFSPVKLSPEGFAPILPDQLTHGSPLTKFTKKKKKRKLLMFVLATDGSMVSWNPSKPAKSFFVDDIKSIRYGEDALNYRQEFGGSAEEEDRWFTVLCTDHERPKQTRTIHLVAPSKSDRFLWVDTLEALAKHRQDLMTGLSGSGDRENVLQAHWEREMKKRFSTAHFSIEDGSLDLQAIKSLCRGLHIHCSQAMIEEHFRSADSRGTGQLSYNEFKSFVRHLKERKDIAPIFRNLLRDDEQGLTQERFFHFLKCCQGIDISANRTRWTNEFNKWANLTASQADSAVPGVPDTDSELVDMDAFAAFLTSEACSIYFPSGISMPFDEPLNEYFISSSHNTYLQSRQVAGTASTEAYITALQRGCRCIELDCWDGPDGKPNVTHGHTRTAPVLFVDCIHVINRYAFEASEYPVILSLEVHCNPEQQLRMVQIMKDGFGEKLVLHPIPDAQKTLPSPESLKNRILVKVKTSEGLRENSLPRGHTDIGRQRSASSPHPRAELSEIAVFSGLPTLSNPPSVGPPNLGFTSTYSPGQTPVTATSGSSAGSAGEESDAPVARNGSSKGSKKKAKTNKIIKELAELGIYFQGYKYRGFTAPEAKQFNHIFSLDERKAEYICRNPQEKAQFEDHNVRYMLRVYPKFSRWSSSNFDPNLFWKRGVQMVALNWQTYDANMQMNQAMFAAGTDHHGFVLKPKSLRQPRTKDGNSLQRVKLPKNHVKFTIEMISAQQLPLLPSMNKDANINPFIEIQVLNADDKARGIVIGTGGDGTVPRTSETGIGTPYSRRTKIVIDNGFNPQFNDQFDISLDTKYPELVFVRWIVWNSQNGRYASNSTQLAVFTAKLSSLQQGYRHLPLYNGNGEEFIFSTLFCKIKKEEPVPIPFPDIRTDTREGILRGVFSRARSNDRSNEWSHAQQKQKLRVNKEILDRGPQP